TSYATHGEHMIPVYVFYSMFGFQRTGDQMWALGDQMGRGFLLGATAGRTTLNGEGLQHQDGHSLLLAQTNPACVAYDPAFAFEISYITQDGLDRMYGERDEPVFYYLTVYNEPYPQPAEPEGVDVEGLLKGLYLYRPAAKLEKAPGDDAVPAQLMASGSAMLGAQRAQEMLAEDWGVAADLWSATSWNELHREAVEREKENLLSPEEPHEPYVTRVLADTQGPVVAVSDFQRAVPDQIARWVPTDWQSLGTDGYGRSDTRAALRRYFRIDAPSIVVATLQALARRGDIDIGVVKDALARYQLDDDQATDSGSATEADEEPVSD
ncbi:MAG: pyruvate dehydrogenase component, partial [Frankiaceae bacterium]|nr:pyruvate dehydrogenase component [Frankiaceae bacterium]